MKRKNNKRRIISSIVALALVICLAVTASPSAKAAKTSDPVDYSSTGKLRNVMYYGDWSIWGGQGNFYPGGIPADQLTHLNFAFVDFDASGNLIFCDKDAATGAPVGMPGVQWGAANAGILSAFQHLRAENPNLRIGVSLGGWSKSGDFSTVAANASTRKVFVDNVLKFIKYTNMDFVDLDWEYPGENQYREPDKCDNTNDEGTTKASAADKENYILLLQDFRAALDKQGKDLKKTYELTVALPAPKSKLDDGIDIKRLFEVVDFANIMTYDMRGAWDEFSGHQTGLYTNPADPYADAGLSVHDSVEYLKSNGAPADKIVIGCAFYTRGWNKVEAGDNSSLPGLFGAAAQNALDADQAPSRGAVNEAPLKNGEGGRRGGVWSYGSLDKLKSNYPGMKEYWDDTAKAPYLYDASTGVFFTYDNERSIKEKAAYVKANNLGGIISWMQSQDAVSSTGKRDKLTRTIKEALFGSADLQAYNISDCALDLNVKIETFKEEWTNNAGYTISIKNNATKNESGEVLSLVELAGETVKTPKLYIKTKSGATFKGSGYGSGNVTNENGVCIVDLSTVYDNQTIGQGATCTFSLASSVTPDLNDIISIELAQRITASGVEISRQLVYGNDVPTPTVKPTATPTATPTVKPTVAPTATPTVKPTVAPTATPTVKPTATPTVKPTVAPTATPSVKPTVAPTVKPTVAPTATPSGNTYDPTKIYTAGDKVVYNGVTYVCKWWTQGTAPDALYGPWEAQSTQNPDGSQNYLPGKAYVGGDVVSYNGANYKANWWTMSTPGSDSSWTRI